MALNENETIDSAIESAGQDLFGSKDIQQDDEQVSENMADAEYDEKTEDVYGEDNASQAEGAETGYGENGNVASPADKQSLITDQPMTEMQQYDSGFARMVDGIAKAFGNSPVGKVLEKLAKQIEDRVKDKKGVAFDNKNTRAEMDNEISASFLQGNVTVVETPQQTRQLEKMTEKYPVRTGKMINDMDKELRNVPDGSTAAEREEIGEKANSVTRSMTEKYYGKLYDMEKSGKKLSSEEKWMIDEMKPDCVDVKYSEYEPGMPLVKEKQSSIESERQFEKAKDTKDKLDEFDPNYSDEEMKELEVYGEADKIERNPVQGGVGLESRAKKSRQPSKRYEKPQPVTDKNADKEADLGEMTRM